MNHTNESRDKILHILMVFSKICPYRAPDFSIKEVAWYWCKEFGLYDPDLIKNAIQSHISEHDHFPSIREITQRIKPHSNINIETQSQLISMNIISSIRKFGSYNWRDAKNFLGKNGELVVERMGGWTHICEVITNENISYMTNMIKENAKSILKEVDANGHSNTLLLDKCESTPLLKALEIIFDGKSGISNTKRSSEISESEKH